MVTGELKRRLIVNYLQLLWLESKGAQSPCQIEQQAPAPVSTAISPRNLLWPTRFCWNFRKLKCKRSRWTGVFCSMSEKFRQSQGMTDPRGQQCNPDNQLARDYFSLVYIPFKKWVWYIYIFICCYFFPLYLTSLEIRISFFFGESWPDWHHKYVT